MNGEKISIAELGLPGPIESDLPDHSDVSPRVLQHLLAGSLIGH